MQAGFDGDAAEIVGRADHQHQGVVEPFPAHLTTLVVQHFREPVWVDVSPDRAGPVAVGEGDVRDYES
ncbi:hypothetical protein NN3_01290 [Nocardia neocaledoniensis NBRC 108232]|nr:hypothetical protein NN3_01290 [Nocardia neocaledoniensis NBRC 108232]